MTSRTSPHAAFARRTAAFATMLALAGWFGAAPAFALSEIKQEDVPPSPSITSQPLPPPAEAPADDEAPAQDGDSAPAVQSAAPVPEVLYDTSQLPEPVRILREKIIAACKAGDLEALRPLLGTGQDATQLSFGAIEGDPLDFLRQASGDEQGYEILAILEEVLDAGYVHLDAGTPQELYVWPYFFAMPLESLTPPQKVELFKLITAGDFEEMKGFGAYIFYRVGITPAGRWVFFVAGD